jgi:SAM-dependent methyltransferase
MESMYSKEFADVYDLVYTTGRGKDYAAETDAVVRLIRGRNPAARSVLDVACGTGEHLRYLRESFADVEGLELSEPMRAQAIEKLPGMTVHAGDMRGFSLGRTFDVVLCLFSAVGYARSVDELCAAGRAMAAHVTKGGILIVDPWYHPGGWVGGMVDHTVAVGNGRTVLRMAHSTLDGHTSRVTYHYLVGDANGVVRFTDVHEMSLFTPEEYVEAFRAGGCASVEFMAGWAPGRDRIVAVKG